jgi:hypothetical protein
MSISDTNLDIEGWRIINQTLHLRKPMNYNHTLVPFKFPRESDDLNDNPQAPVTFGEETQAPYAPFQYHRDETAIQVDTPQAPVLDNDTPREETYTPFQYNRDETSSQYHSDFDTDSVFNYERVEDNQPGSDSYAVVSRNQNLNKTIDYVNTRSDDKRYQGHNSSINPLLYNIIMEIDKKSRATHSGLETLTTDLENTKQTLKSAIRK